MNPTNRTAYNLLLKNWFQYEAGHRAIANLFYHGLQKNGCVNCFVNLNEYLSPLYKRNDYEIDDPYTVAASIINFCAHLIYFFNSRFGIQTAVYLVYGSDRPYYAITTCEEYNAHKINMLATKPEVTAMIEENFKVLELLASYIPNVYFFRDDNCEPVVAMRRIMKYISLKGNKHPCLLFSREFYDLQLVATTPRTHLVRVKKTMQGDQTFTVSYHNFYSQLTKLKKLKVPIGVGVSPELYSLYLAYMGCRDKNIRAILTANNTDARIHSLIDRGILLNGYNPSITASVIIMREYIEDEIALLGVMDRYKAMDIVFQSLDQDTTTPMCEKVMTELYDPDGVRQIANQYFLKYPLDLNVF